MDVLQSMFNSFMISGTNLNCRLLQEKWNGMEGILMGCNFGFNQFKKISVLTLKHSIAIAQQKMPSKPILDSFFL